MSVRSGQPTACRGVCIVFAIAASLGGCRGCSSLDATLGVPGARQGAPIVVAIEAYHDAHGVWPESLDELVPTQLAALPDPAWRYGHWPLVDDYSLQTPAAGRLLAYHHSSGWTLGDRDHSVHVPVEAPVLSHPLPEPALSEQIEQTFAHRAAADPSRPEHHECLVSFFVLAGRTSDALAASERATTVAPERAWNQAALAELRARARLPDAGRSLEEWASRAPSLARYNRVITFARDHDDAALERAAIDRAVRQPLNPDDRDAAWIPEALVFIAAREAVRLGSYDVALAMCASWEGFVARQGYGIHDFHAIRAVVHLVHGEVAEARRELALQREAGARATWIADLTPLEQAIAAGRTGEPAVMLPDGMPGGETPVLFQRCY